jgi:L-fucose isomerase-like protein
MSLKTCEEVAVIKVKYLRSDHVDVHFDEVSQTFLQSLSEAFGDDIVIDKKEAIEPGELPLFFIASGGTEEVFLRRYSHTTGPVYLLTMEKRNSLAASMEILSYLRERGIPGQILHGSVEELASQLHLICRTHSVKQKLQGLRLGVTEPSGWLIASKVDRDLLKRTSGIEMIDLSMEELCEEIDKKEYPQDALTQDLASKQVPSLELEKALHVYGGVKRIAQKHNLHGISIKCFDLLEPYKTSGCLALALLNAQGIHAACEGDERSLLSMAVLAELTGEPIFMCNPARLHQETRDIVLAHCVLPLNMPQKYTLMTHYESGIGLAISADLSKERYTLFKMKENFQDYVAMEGTLTQNLHEDDMCRTQIRLRMDEPLDYFLKRPIANHHMVVRGEHKELIAAFLNSY